MPQSLQYNIKSSFLSRARQLVIEPGSITFDNNLFGNSSPTKFLKNDIAGIRYGVRGIRGYSFNIGRVYCIDVKDIGGAVIKIRFRSFYGVRREELDDMYRKILKALHENFMDDMCRIYLKKFSDKEDFNILGITFTQDGLMLDKKWDIIPWLDVSTKNYNTYYAVFSMTEPTKNKTFKYISDWNTSVLYSVSRGILKSKGLWKE